MTNVPTAKSPVSMLPATTTTNTTAVRPVAQKTAAPRQTPTSGDTMGYSNAEAMRIMMRAGQTGRDLAAKLRNAANKDEIGAKQAGVRDQAAQIKGERTSTMVGLASKLTATGAQAYAGGKGSAMRRSTDDNKMSLGAGLDSAAQGGAIGNVITSASDMGDKLFGGAHQADQAKIALKLDDVATSLATQRKDSANAAVTQSDKVIEGAMDAMRDFRSRAAAVIDKLTGG